MTPEIRIDQKRGCGWRKEGGLYLVGPETGQPCGLLPIPLERCPCCDQGIKPTRGWTWVDVGLLLKGRECLAADISKPGLGPCRFCPGRTLEGRHGLLWIGEQFYATPEEFLQETRRQGVSRRLTQVPRDFKAGETWVLLAHRKVIPVQQAVQLDSSPKPEPEYLPGVFQMFKPTAIEYVTKGTETAEELEALVKRGITPVTVQRDDGTLFSQAAGGAP
jgi:hypothetical protein